MKIKLASLSPLSFEAVKLGDKVSLRVRGANKNEYRDKIGAAQDVFLVFKGQTKIGMVPKRIGAENHETIASSNWRVVEIDPSKGVLVLGSDGD